MRVLTLAALISLAGTASADSLFDSLDKFYVGGGFNFIDARYYDVFATVGGNRVSLLWLPARSIFALSLDLGMFLIVSGV